MSPRRQCAIASTPHASPPMNAATAAAAVSRRRSARPSWSRTAPTSSASRSASCATRRSPRTRCTTCSRRCSPAAPRFGGRAALRSWLTAVLKHKIVDAVRRAPLHESLDDERRRRRPPATTSPARSRGPDEVAEQRQLLARALAGIDALPAGAARRDAAARARGALRPSRSARELGISEENLFVRVHRARKQPALLSGWRRRCGARAPRAQIIAAGSSRPRCAKRVTLRGSRCTRRAGLQAEAVAQREPLGARHLDVDVALVVAAPELEPGVRADGQRLRQRDRHRARRRRGDDLSSCGRT